MYSGAGDCGGTGGTSIARSKTGESVAQTAAVPTLTNAPKSSIVANDCRSFSHFPAPKYSLIKTPAPIQSPLTAKIIKFITGGSARRVFAVCGAFFAKPVACGAD